MLDRSILAGRSANAVLAATLRAGAFRPAWQVAVLRLALALACAGAGVAGAAYWRDAAASAAVPATALVDVLVMTKTLEPGDRIERAALRWQPWPRDNIDPQWVTGQHAIAGIIGRRSNARLAKGAPLTMAMLAGAGSGLATMIGAGQRAMTIAVTPAAGLGGFIVPGDRVDVLLVQTLGKRHTSQTLLTGVIVLGVDQNSSDVSNAGAAAITGSSDAVASAVGGKVTEPPALITLQVTASEARALALAVELGKLTLVLRGNVAAPETLAGAAADTATEKGRSWDTDVTGLSAQTLGRDSESNVLAAAAPPIAPATSVAAAAPAQKTGVEIIYGLQPAEALK